MPEKPDTGERTLLLIGLVSATMLFLEMVLIRWVAAEIRVFAYMHNLLLVASFFGIGLGCYRADASVRWTRGLAALALLVLLVTDPLRLEIGEQVTRGLAAARDSVIWAAFPRHGTPTLELAAILAEAVLLTLAFVALTALSLEPFGQLLGRWLNSHPHPVAAYSANLLGSLVGTWAFFVMCSVLTGPELWFGVFAGFSALLLFQTPQSPSVRAGRAILLVIPIALVLASVARQTALGAVTIWSPYQKLAVAPLYIPPPAGSSGQGKERAGYAIRVNNTWYQNAMDLSEAFRARRPDLYANAVFTNYELPYQVLPPPARVLIVGAGSGNDVAAALRHGASEVDAVDIDPEILNLGLSLHPEHPYADPRVRATVCDARSFFKQGTPHAYDLIWFGLLDSHTTGSSYSTLRLDHYVYTRQSFAEARRLLKPGGVLVCIFETQPPWIGDRIAGLLEETFGRPPISLHVFRNDYMGWLGEVFFAGEPEPLERVTAAFRASPTLEAFLKQHQTRHGGGIRLTDDDWPYLYLRRARIPSAYLLVSVVLAALFVRLRRGLVGGQRMSWPFFFLGAAFLLVEVLGVSRAAMLFGATWMVTAIVVSGVLCMALLANVWVTARRSRSLLAPLIGIVLSGGAIALIPMSVFGSLSMVAKVIAVGGFLGAPLFFSGVLFTRLYQEAPSKGVALGSNLFGAMAGGLCEQASFVFGLRALTAFAVLLYVAAVIAVGRRERVVGDG